MLPTFLAIWKFYTEYLMFLLWFRKSEVMKYMSNKLISVYSLFVVFFTYNLGTCSVISGPDEGSSKKKASVFTYGKLIHFNAF